MSAFLDLLLPAIVTTIVLVAIHTFFGLHVLRRNIVFIDLALAQMAALGATVAFSIGYAPLSATSYAYSFAFALGGAILLSGLRFLPTRIPHEALIGILYIVATAATILFIENSPQGAEHLKQLLTGNIVTVSIDDALGLLPLYAGIALVLVVVTRTGGFERAGLAGWGFDLLFYALFAAVVTSSVSIAGVLLVFSFLIIPACIGIVLADSMSRQWLWGVAFGSLAGVAGLAAAYTWDWSAGGAVVCAFGAMLAVVGLGKFGQRAFKNGDAPRVIRVCAMALAGVLVLSGAWSISSPRADQPLLNSVARLVPAVHTWTMSEPEQRVVTESLTYAKRHQAEAERLNRMEADDRASGNLSDEKLAKIASFIKNYNEMRTGEEFVAQETLARARVRNRWWLGLGQVGVGVMICGAAYGWRRRKTGVLSITLAA